MKPSPGNPENGTSAFAAKVYEALRHIPEGRVATYGQIAEIIGCPGGSRAVGNALHVNPFAPAVPCHRVVAADGSLAANFGSGGPSVQRSRLAAEGVRFVDGTHVDLSGCGIVIEKHPLEPFLPGNGRILYLGSFPPPKSRWSMDFFYPNWINDFWRIQGLVHFGDAHHFETGGGVKRFDRDRIISFCSSEGLAFFDTALKVCRLKGNASDDCLEILESSDVPGMLSVMPGCNTVVTTGGKSSEEFLSILRRLDDPFSAEGTDISAPPEVGRFVDVPVLLPAVQRRSLRWWRMPSSSRAYPMPLRDKASIYARLRES